MTGGASIAASGTKNNLELDTHAKELRQSLYETMTKRFVAEYKEQVETGNICTKEEAQEALGDLQKTASLADNLGITPIASELLNLFLNQDFKEHGIIKINEFEEGYKIVEFGDASIVNKELRNKDDMNITLVKTAILEKGRAPVEQPTYMDSYSFYLSGTDCILGLGKATAIVTFKKELIQEHGISRI